MFKNIGSKIKDLALLITAISIILCVMIGIIMIVINKNLIILGLLIMVVGSLLSWVSSFVLYGFGQLIENTDILVQKAQTAVDSPKNVSTDKKSEASFNNQHHAKKKKNLSKEFLAEIKDTATSDLELILVDQQDLYSKDEIEFIQNELVGRKNNSL